MTGDSRSSRLDDFIAQPRRALWRLALPIMIGMSVQTVYMLADMYFVGQVSSEALAALAFNMPLVFLGIGIIFGLGSGVTAVIVRYIGAGDKELADSAAEHAVALGVVISAIFTLVAYWKGRELLAVLGVPENLMALAWGYFRILAGGYIFLVMSVFFRSILSGEGDVKTPVMIQGGGTLLNIVLDPIFIFTLEMGVEGAALATVLSQALAALVFVYLLFFKEHSYCHVRPQRFSLLSVAPRHPSSPWGPRHLFRSSSWPRGERCSIVFSSSIRTRPLRGFRSARASTTSTCCR